VKRRADLRVVGVTILAAAMWAALLAGVAQLKFGGDPRGFLFLGETLHHPPALDGIPRCGRFGYDGQFYAALATDPFLRSPETLKSLDAPGYRASRILLPMLAWGATLGDARAAIVAYQLLSWTLAILAVAAVSLRLAGEGRSPWWGLLLAVNAGCVTTIFRSTQDGAGVFLIVATLGLAAGRRDRAGLGAGSCAGLCRETGYLAPLAIGVRELIARRYRRGIAYVLVPLAPLLAWQAYLQARWHPNLRVPASVAAPVVALAGKVAAVAGAHPFRLSQEFWATLGVVLTVLAGLGVALGRRRLEPERLVFVAFAILALFLAPRAYADAYGFSRQLMPAPFLALVLVAREESRLISALLVASVVAFSLAGVLMILGELSPLIGRL
jgi:hypothetical protein